MRTAEVLEHVKLALKVPLASRVLKLLLQNVGDTAPHLALTDEQLQATTDSFKLELVALLNLEPIPDFVQALFFGVAPVTVSDEPSWIHLLGSPEYSAENRHWADEGDDRWLPGQRYFRLHELHLMMDRLDTTAQHAAGLYVAGELVKAAGPILSTYAPVDRELPVCIGWENAELMLVGHVARSGWVPSN